ncbi:MAG: hypothetical protein ACRBK7_15930 [Acidimicrobiales bacterium]
MSFISSKPGSTSLGLRVALVAAAVLMAGTVAAVVGPAAPAEAMVHPDTVDLAKLNMIPEKIWGVSGNDPSQTQTESLDTLVWDFAQSGDRMFVGGAFLNVQENRTATPIPQPFVAAFDVDSGDWISTWTPVIDRVVYALDVLPNGSLLLGGEFETVNGTARNGLVALDPLTGAIDPTFSGSIDRPWSIKRGVVRDIKVTGSEVYVAGNYSHLLGVNGSRSRTYKVGRFDLQGNIDTAWKPQVTGSGLWSIDTDPGRNEVYFTGYFSAVNGEADTGYFHTVDGTTGASVPGKVELPRNWPQSQPEMYDVAVGDDLVFVLGEQHVAQVLDADDQQMLGFYTAGAMEDQFVSPNYFAGGAFQVGERIGDVIFAGCHCTYSTRFGWDAFYSSFSGERTTHRLAVAFDASTGELIEDFMPDIHSPADGTWAFGSDTNGCLYIGGDFHVGGVDHGASAWLGGFAKLCGDGPRVHDMMIDNGEAWRFDDSGSDLGTSWRAAAYDDAAWSSGNAPLGFGEGDEGTVLTLGNVTYYARKTFQFDGVVPDSLDLRLKADDGAVVYLNGVEVLRDNMPDGIIGPNTTAVTWRSGAAEDFARHSVSSAPLVQGSNVLAIELHNVWAGSNDLALDVRLGASQDVVAVPPARLIEPGSTWRHSDSSAAAAPAGWPGDLAGLPEAAAEFGFGENDEVTTLVGGQETYYFARNFEVAGVGQVTGLNMCLLVDDGAVVYINGTEVQRVNMPDGAIGWDTRPSDWISNAEEGYVDYSIGAESLVEGTNVISAEVHNYWPGNGDLSFDLCLETVN